MSVPVNEPVITDEAKKYVMDALETGWVSGAGEYIKRFEEEFAAYLGVKHAITTTSGTTALHLALAALNIGEGDEVIVPDFTMIASIFAILYTGAKPVFIDVERETYTLDVAQLESKISERTKAIMPVHIYGHAADMDPIMEIAQKHGVPVCEDAAEIHGGKYKGKMCGTFGDINCFSFYGNKIVTSGEGGMVVTDDDQLAVRARSLKDLAHAPDKRFIHEELGFNYRMTNLQAALGLGQLEHIDEFITKKKWMAEAYGAGLKEIKGLRLPITKDFADNVYWMYAVLVEDDFGLTRDELCAKLKDKGIGTRDFFYSSSAQPAVQKLFPSSEHFPVTEDISQRGFYLPSGLALTQEQVDEVCDAIRTIANDIH